MARKIFKSNIFAALRVLLSIALMGCTFSVFATEKAMIFTCSPPVSMLDRIKKITLPARYGSEYSLKRPFDATFEFETLMLHLIGNRRIELKLIEPIAFLAKRKNKSEACQKFSLYELADSVIFSVTYPGGNPYGPQQVLIANKEINKFVKLEELAGPFSNLASFSPISNSSNCIELISYQDDSRQLGCIVKGRYTAFETTMQFESRSSSYHFLCDMKDSKGHVIELTKVSGRIPDRQAIIPSHIRKEAQELCNRRTAKNVSYQFDF